MATYSDNENTRFATVNKEQFKLIKNKDSRNIRRNTDTGVRIFREYLKSKDLPLDFENFEKERLADVLTQYYVEVRREDGKQYKTGSLINLRAGLNRYLKSLGKEIDLHNEAVFSKANLAFTANQAALKREGFGNTTHHSPIDEKDVAKLYTTGVLDENTPAGLQSKVWFELMLFICRRSRENLRKLERDHFSVATDFYGRRFVYQSKDEMTKTERTSQGNNKKSRVDGRRMYETGVKGCPVASYEKYVSKLNPACPALFQRPLANTPTSNDKPWYAAGAVGERTLGSMMGKLSEEAGLSKHYTNHSIRSTCITVLDKLSFASRDIIAASSYHKCNMRTSNSVSQRGLSPTLL